MKIGEILRITREYFGLRQIDVANMAGIDISTYGKYERGQLTPAPKTIKKLAAALGVKESWCFGMMEQDSEIKLLQFLRFLRDIGAEIRVSKEDGGFAVSFHSDIFPYDFDFSALEKNLSQIGETRKISNTKIREEYSQLLDEDFCQMMLPHYVKPSH